MNKHYIFLLLLMVVSFSVNAQVGINTDNSAPNGSAMLDVKSSNRGMLVPRMTIAERNAIASPANGLLVYCTDNNHFYTNKGTPVSPNWVMISSQWISNGSNITFSGGNVGIGLTNPGFPIDITGDVNFSGTLRKNGIPVITGVSGVSASAPVLSSGGSAPNISIPQATSSASGFLSASDWNNFNNKVSSQWVTNGQDITYNTGKAGIGTTAPAASALLELKSTSRGFLPPRMTAAQRNAITSPADGLMIFCTDCPSPNNLQVYAYGKWNPMAFNRLPIAANVNQTGYPAINLALLGSYSYSDSDNDPQGLSTFKWYRADNPSGLNETAISGATNLSYSMVAADINKYIRFAVTPVATTGASPGDEVKSPGFLGPILNWTCGAPITVNHVAGTTAPVTKTVTYGTVSNIPGEISKCWITSNLGASQQATAVDDATEPSAGWYWQYNRKQGYKHVMRNPWAAQQLQTVCKKRADRIEY
jgi:hypothetical protein